MNLWKQILLILTLSFVSAAIHSQFKPIDTAELGEFAIRAKAFTENKKDSFLLIDVRSEADFLKGHIEGALHFDSADWESSLSKLMEQFTGEEKLYLYCNSDCVASKSVARRLREAGFDQSYYIHGGYKALLEVKK